MPSVGKRRPSHGSTKGNVNFNYLTTQGVPLTTQGVVRKWNLKRKRLATNKRIEVLVPIVTWKPIVNDEEEENIMCEALSAAEAGSHIRLTELRSFTTYDAGRNDMFKKKPAYNNSEVKPRW